MTQDKRPPGNPGRFKPIGEAGARLAAGGMADGSLDLGETLDALASRHADMRQSFSKDATPTGGLGTSEAADLEAQVNLTALPGKIA